MSSDSDAEQIDTKTAVQHVIKPAKGGASIDTSTWPLLLKVCANIKFIQVFMLFHFYIFVLCFWKHSIFTLIFIFYRITIN